MWYRAADPELCVDNIVRHRLNIDSEYDVPQRTTRAAGPTYTCMVSV
jgi:hypothetical protein